MFLRCHCRRKNGKLHRYWSVVESRRLAGGRSAQRQLLYLGEINDSQEAAWRKSIEVFDEDKQQAGQAALFPADGPIPADEVNALSLVMSDIRLLRPRNFGDCWLGCQLWRELGLDRFWQEQLDDQRGSVPWEKVLQLLAINRLCQPASEWAVHRRWFLQSAMDELLECDFAVAEKDRLYRCLDRVLAHKDALCRHLVERWKTLFDARFDILLYDLTSTYFEGSGEKIPKARHGYSRDGRGDCRQVVIALVVTTDGLPLAYEVLSGNRTDKTTLGLFLAKIQSMYGKERFGQMVQMDGSPHDWFEGRGPRCCLMVMIDDATGQMRGRFYPQETLAAAMETFGRWCQEFGIPQSPYVDRSGIYRADREPTPAEIKGKRKPLTQFGRAMKELDVQMILAQSPQAKGRVERANGTLQDRLVKEMRLAGISSIDQANAWLGTSGFFQKLSERFGVKPIDNADGHRPVVIDLDSVLCVKEKRSVSSDGCLQWQGRCLQLTDARAGLKQVELWQQPDGTLRIIDGGKTVSFVPWTPPQKIRPVVKNNRVHKPTARQQIHLPGSRAPRATELAGSLR